MLVRRPVWVCRPVSVPLGLEDLALLSASGLALGIDRAHLPRPEPRGPCRAVDLLGLTSRGDSVTRRTSSARPRATTGTIHSAESKADAMGMLQAAVSALLAILSGNARNVLAVLARMRTDGPPTPAYLAVRDSGQQTTTWAVHNPLPPRRLRRRLEGAASCLPGFRDNGRFLRRTNRLTDAYRVASPSGCVLLPSVPEKYVEDPVATFISIPKARGAVMSSLVGAACEPSRPGPAALQ